MTTPIVEIVRFCETCKHWDFSETSNRYTPPKDQSAACVRTRWNGDYPEDRESKANAFASDGGDAVLFTRRNFGCIQHEAKV